MGEGRLVAKPFGIVVGGWWQCAAWSWRDCIIREHRPSCGLKAAMRSPGASDPSTDRRPALSKQDHSPGELGQPRTCPESVA